MLFVSLSGHQRQLSPNKDLHVDIICRWHCSCLDLKIEIAYVFVLSLQTVPVPIFSISSICKDARIQKHKKFMQVLT
jgi:hypothetical protein